MIAITRSQFIFCFEVDCIPFNFACIGLRREASLAVMVFTGGREGDVFR